MGSVERNLIHSLSGASGSQDSRVDMGLGSGLRCEVAKLPLALVPNLPLSHCAEMPTHRLRTALRASVRER